jgi:hypothetical protein
MEVRYFRMTSDRLNEPVYYASYSEDRAKEVAYSDYNSQFVIKCEEIRFVDIPDSARIHGAYLLYEDAKALVERDENSK